MQIVNVLIGGTLLAFGRKLFWLFIAAAGFIAGWDIALRFVNGPAWLAIAIGVIVALAAAILALTVKKVAIGVAGILMGGWLMVSLAGMLGMGQGANYWGFFLVGALAGVLFMGLLFDLALIWLSSLAGALLIMDAFNLAGVVRILVFVGVLFVGVVLQTSLWDKNEED